MQLKYLTDSLLKSDMQGRQTGGGVCAQLRLIDLCRIGR